MDLGSQCITLRQADADYLGIAYTKPTDTCKIGGYGSGHVIPCGITQAHLTVDQASAEVPIYIVPSDVQAIPLLVGQPFTDQPHITVVRRKNVVRIFEENESADDEDDRLRGINVPNLPPRRATLWAKESTVIPPGYIGIVTLSAGGEKDGDVYVDAQLRMQEGKEHCLPSCIIHVDEDGTSFLPVLNVSDSAIHVTQGKVTARGSWCHEEPETSCDHIASSKCLIPFRPEAVRTGTA